MKLSCKKHKSVSIYEYHLLGVHFLESLSQLYNQKICITHMVKTQLYVFAQNSTLVYNYMFRPCVLAIVSLYCIVNKQLYSMCMGYCGETTFRLTLVVGMVLDHYGSIVVQNHTTH